VGLEGVFVWRHIQCRRPTVFSWATSSPSTLTWNFDRNATLWPPRSILSDAMVISLHREVDHPNRAVSDPSQADQTSAGADQRDPGGR
jgi:hypothetical protein